MRASRSVILARIIALGVALATAAHARVLPDDRPPEPEPAPGPATAPDPSAPAPATPATPTPAPTPTPSPPTSPPAQAPGQALGQAPTQPAAASPAVPFPHPLITEILFAVPTGDSGDASGDGVRDVSGDEFIELVNPHPRPISLRGYSLADAAALAPRGTGSSGTGVRFAFPAMDLPPGAVVVVFNGRNTTFTGPAGDTHVPPTGPNPAFNNALVLSMKLLSQRASLSNTADEVNLVAPDGSIVQRIRWGKRKDGAPAPRPAALDETAPTTTRASVERDGLSAAAAAWRISTADGKPFSPGVVPFVAPGAAPDARPTPPKR